MTREVIVLRHAIAFERDRRRWPDDALRPLTPAGKRRFRKAAQAVRRDAGILGRMVQLAPSVNPYLGAGYGATKPFSEDTARIVDAEVLRILNECHDQAKDLLRAHRPQLDALVKALLSRETLDEREILEVTGLPPAPALESRRVAAAASR